MNELTLQKMDIFTDMATRVAAINNDTAMAVVDGAYGMLQLGAMTPENIKEIELAKLDTVVAGAIKANALIEVTTIQLARVYARYYKKLKKDGKVTINGTTYKTQTALGEHFGLNKQRASEYAHISTLPIIYDNAYSTWTLGQFNAAYEVINTKKAEFKGKITLDMINPSMSMGDINKLIEKDKAIADVDSTVKTSTENDTENAENGNENTENGTENAENGNESAENDNVNKCKITVKGNTVTLTNATATDLQAWVHKSVSTNEKVGRMNVTVTFLD